MPQQERAPIWAIPRGAIAAYFGLFTLFDLFGLTFIVWYDIFITHTTALHDTIRMFILNAGPIAVGSAGLALTIIEAPRSTMVFASYLSAKLLEPLKEKQRQEGREQGRAEWRAWNNRRLEAESRGEPFNEPPPGE